MDYDDECAILSSSSLSPGDPNASLSPDPSLPTSEPVEPHVTFKNAVYYPNYRVYRGQTPRTLDYTCISHVYYAFANVDTNGTVSLSDYWADTELTVDQAQGCMGSLVQLRKEHPHLRILLSIGGGNNSKNFEAVARSPLRRDEFAKSAKVLVKSLGIDGIDIDWEHPATPEQGWAFLDLLLTVRVYMPCNKYLLTAALPAGRWALKNIKLDEVERYLDFLNLMAYDFVGPWTSRIGHHAQLYPRQVADPCGSGAVDYVLSTGFPSAKILLGVPLYGRPFAHNPRTLQLLPGSSEHDTIDFKDLPPAGYRERVDKDLAVAMCIRDHQCISYDNPQTVAIKAAYCKKKGLGGLFYWQGTADAPPGTKRSCIEAGFKALNDLQTERSEMA